VRLSGIAKPPSIPTLRLVRPSFSVMSNSDSSAQGFVDRVQSFVTENKRAILIGTALAVAAGGVALYASASSSPKAPRDKKDRKKSGKPKPRDVESNPIIEEIPVEDQPSKSLSFVYFAAASRRRLTSCLSPLDFGVVTKEQLEGMSTEVRVL
jgi:hypothetical protein